MSFPVFDDRTFIEGVNWNDLGYIIDEHMMFPFDAMLAGSVGVMADLRER